MDESDLLLPGFSTDPYLAYQPAFAYSLAIQLFVNGITLTLLLTLLIHFLFTTQYHYPLAPLNWILQLGSIVVVLTSVIIKVVVILRGCSDQADQWPYDQTYVGLSIPPGNWNTGQNAAWFLLQALNNGFANVAHIQFLTLLFPSRSEARLIIIILGPLAITASGLVFTALAPTQKILDVGDAIRNVLNSTLLLIFTIALFLWGFLVNRRRAWRWDGGTAVFGFGALLLAVVTTSFNFVAVAEDGIDWLQHLLFAGILWQIWLGWWWWVGSGMGIGEVEDLMEKAERKKRKAAKKAARQRALDRASGGLASRAKGSSLASGGAQAVAGVKGFTTSVGAILRTRSSTLIRRNTARSQADEGQTDEEHGRMGSSHGRERDIELDDLRPARVSSPVAETGTASERDRTERNGPGSASGGVAGSGSAPRVNFSSPAGSRTNPTTNSETSSTSATPSLHIPRSVGQLFSFPTTWLQVYLRRLQHAHEDAARKQALQRAERREQVLGRRPSRTGAGDGETAGGVAGEGKVSGGATRSAARLERGVTEGDEVGWGLGRFGILEQREGARRVQEARERLEEGRLLSPSAAAGDGEGAGAALGGAGDGPSVRRRDHAQPNDPSAVSRTGPGASAGAGADEARGGGGARAAQESDWEDLPERPSTQAGATGPAGHGNASGQVRSSRTRRAAADPAGGEGTDVDNDSTSDGTPERARRRGAGGGAGVAEQGGQRGSGRGWSWWGPLRDWRLNDRGTF